MSAYVERLIERLRNDGAGLSHEAANELESCRRDAELYRHMLAVAHANGYGSLTEAIAARPRDE